MKRLHFHPVDYACFLSFLCYSSSAVVTPVALLVMAEELGFALGSGGLIEVSRNLLNLGVLLGAGFMAARYGKIRTLGGGSIIMGIGLALYAVAPNFGLVLLAVGVVGAGGGAIEALVNPLVQDAHPRDSGRYLNFVNGFWSVGVLLTVLLTGRLLADDVSWRLLLTVLGGVSVLSGVLFLSLKRVAPPDHSMGSRLIRRNMLDIVRRRRFWVFMAAMFFGGAAEGAFTFWTATLVGTEFEGSLWEGGVATAFFATGMMVGRFGSGWLVGQHRLGALIIGSAAAGAGLTCLVPLTTSLFELYLLLFAIGLSIACFWPSIQSFAADQLPVDSTILFILLSCAGIPGLAFAGWIIGFVADQSTFRHAFWIPPMLLLMLAVIMIAIVLYQPRSSTDQKASQ